ncbi:MAG: hypothetical protein WA903_12240, partial [Ornithinimicrobium sp.]
CLRSRLGPSGCGTQGFRFRAGIDRPRHHARSTSLAAFGALSLCIWNAPLLTANSAYIATFNAIGEPRLTLMSCLLTPFQAHT